MSKKKLSDKFLRRTEIEARELNESIKINRDKVIELKNNVVEDEIIELTLDFHKHELKHYMLYWELANSLKPKDDKTDATTKSALSIKRLFQACNDIIMLYVRDYNDAKLQLKKLSSKATKAEHSEAEKKLFFAEKILEKVSDCLKEYHIKYTDEMSSFQQKEGNDDEHKQSISEFREKITTSGTRKLNLEIALDKKRIAYYKNIKKIISLETKIRNQNATLEKLGSIKDSEEDPHASEFTINQDLDVVNSTLQEIRNNKTAKLQKLEKKLSPLRFTKENFFARNGSTILWGVGGSLVSLPLALSTGVVGLALLPCVLGGSASAVFINKVFSYLKSPKVDDDIGHEDKGQGKFTLKNIRLESMPTVPVAVPMSKKIQQKSTQGASSQPNIGKPFSIS